MALTKRQTDSKKGKARIYICLPCGFRHEAPTGANCTWSQPQEGHAGGRDVPLPTRRPVPAARPSVQATAATSPERAADPMDDESLEVVLAVVPPQKRKCGHAELPAKRMCPIPAPRLPVSRQLPSSAEEDAEGLFMSHLQLAQEANQARCDQIAAEGRAEQYSIRASIVALSSRIKESLTRPASTVPQPTVQTPAQVPEKPQPTPQAEPTPSTSGLASHTPTSGEAITPEQLEEAVEPEKSLRHDRSTSSITRGILQEIGLIATADKDKRRHRKTASGKCREAPEGADWPEEYVYRLDGSEPSYDSLSLPEFVAAIISIMEELTPVLASTAKVIRLFHYYRTLMEGCFEVEWAVARTAHKQVLQGLEHKRIVWSYLASCIDMKRNALQRAQRRQVDASLPVSHPPQPPPAQVHPCPDYQVLNCTNQGEHWSNGRNRSQCCAWLILFPSKMSCFQNLEGNNISQSQAS